MGDDDDDDDYDDYTYKICSLGRRFVFTRFEFYISLERVTENDWHFRFSHI